MANDRKTIRNIDPDVLLEARVFALQNNMNLGELVTYSLLFFIEEADLESWDHDLEVCD